MPSRTVLVTLTVLFTLAAVALALPSWSAWPGKRTPKTAARHKHKNTSLAKSKARLAASKAPPGQARRLAARQKLKASESPASERVASSKHKHTSAKAAPKTASTRAVSAPVKKNHEPSKPPSKTAPPKVIPPVRSAHERPVPARENLFDVTN